MSLLSTLEYNLGETKALKVIEAALKAPSTAKLVTKLDDGQFEY